MELYYLSSNNKKLDLTRWPYLILEHDLHDFDKGYIVKSGVLTEFQESLMEMSLTLNVSADSPEDYNSALNEFSFVTEGDVKKNKPGKLYYGNQYLLCNMIASTKADWSMGVDYLKNTVTIIMRYPYWITEQHFSFSPANQSISTLSDGKNLDYPHDYPHDYAYEGTMGVITNSHYDSCNFSMVIYGPCINPCITIAGHDHEVYVTLKAGEYLQIESKRGQRTVEKVAVNGEETNEFDNRNWQSDLFRKIPEGPNIVTWDGTFGFEITLYYERSEPVWTS